MFKRIAILGAVTAFATLPMFGCAGKPAKPVVNEEKRDAGFKEGSEVSEFMGAEADRDMPEGIAPID